MKKVLIVMPVMLVILVVGLILYNNRTISTINMDINPSIEINLKKGNKVKGVNALNDDAKEIVSNDLKGKSLEDTLDIIVKNVIDKGYTDDKQVTILLYSTGNIDNGDLRLKVGNSFMNQSIATDIIVIDKVTKEDQKLAKEYNISPAKAAYINSILKENKNMDVANLADDSARSLTETKNRGKYCDKGYELEGDWCYKEVERKKASTGDVCPNGYLEYEGKCYEEVPINHTDKLMCREEFVLDNNKCKRTVTMNAEAVKFSCTSGKAMTNLEAGYAKEGDGHANDIVCVDTSKATHPVSPCETHDGTEYLVSGGKCYWHRAPVIDTGCPGKVRVGGECWDDATGIYICEGYRDGKRYNSKDELCEHSIKVIAPEVTEYKCPSDYSLSGSKCLKDEVEEAFNEMVCPSGYTQVFNDRCINKNKTANSEKGFVCEYENSRLKGNECIIYEVIESKDN